MVAKCGKYLDGKIENVDNMKIYENENNEEGTKLAKAKLSWHGNMEKGFGGVLDKSKCKFKWRRIQ
jgi:hypothetical protein